ncbi:MAG: formate/nitrite transporter family protein [Lachnospiraceae bacterium]|nr:formate/nitrite transporter family protein [Lachnospiraceae bacterium]
MRPKTPPEYVEAYVNTSVIKATLPVYKLIILGIMAGAFVAIGAASASAAAHGIDNVGIAKSLAGIVFPIGMMMIVFIGGELFTGDTMMLMGVFHKRFSYLKYFRTLAFVYISNMIGAIIVAFLVVYSGQLKYSSGGLGAYTIKVAVDKVNGEFVSLFFSGILCNVLVCVAVLMSMAAKDAAGKVFGFLFPIFAFVIGGYEHCVANMYFIPAGFLAAKNPVYYEKAMELYGLTAEQIGEISFSTMLFQNLLPVTLGNMVAGMFLISLPLYVLYKDVIFRNPTHREYLQTEKENAVMKAMGHEKHK